MPLPEDHKKTTPSWEFLILFLLVVIGMFPQFFLLIFLSPWLIIGKFFHI